MRLLIVIARDEYVRNYGETGAFDALRREHECVFAVADRCRMSAELAQRTGTPVRTFRTDPALERAHHELFNVLTWHHRRRSRTFAYRFSRFYRTYPFTSARNIARGLQGLVQAAKYVLLGNRLVGRVAIPRMIARIPVDPELDALVRDVAPDLVLFPCSAYDATGNDLARLGPRHGFRTLFLVDNWDNLSSKSIFWAVPDHLGVWGEQSRRHALEIHGIPPERVTLLGTPRFEAYYRTEKVDAASPYPFPYILFCGAALAFDELGALRRLDAELVSHPEIYGGTRIVYRPHPYRQPRLCPDVFRETDFRCVVLDRQVADAYYRRDVNFHPSLDYYPSLLAGARLVVCPLTTMLIESLICRTPVVALAYDDGIHYTSPHNAYRYYLHFEGIEGIDGLRIIDDVSRVGAGLRDAFVTPAALTRTGVDAALQPFLHRDRQSYAERLAALVAALGTTTGASRQDH